jgi:hypothetical protein
MTERERAQTFATQTILGALTQKWGKNISSINMMTTIFNCITLDVFPKH